MPRLPARTMPEIQSGLRLLAEKAGGARFSLDRFLFSLIEIGRGKRIGRGTPWWGCRLFLEFCIFRVSWTKESEPSSRWKTEIPGRFCSHWSSPGMCYSKRESAGLSLPLWCLRCGAFLFYFSGNYKSLCALRGGRKNHPQSTQRPQSFFWVKTKNTNPFADMNSYLRFDPPGMKTWGWTKRIFFREG